MVDEEPPEIPQLDERGRQHWRGRHRRPPYPAAPPPPRRDAGDVATIVGLPRNQISEPVQRAIVRLMEETDRLRQDLEHARAREHHLEDEADRHAFLPVLNRRALERELGRSIDYVDRAHVPCTLALFGLPGLLNTYRVHGRFVAEGVMAEAARTVAEGVRSTDLVGAVSDSMLAVIFTQSDPAGAGMRCDTLAERVAALRVPTDTGGTIAPEAAFALQPITADTTVHDLLQAADDDLRPRIV